MKRLALIALVVTACAGSGSDPGATATSADAAVETTAPDAPPTTAAPDDVSPVTQPEPTAPAPDFSKEPFVMFAPVPPTPDGLDIPLPDGAIDFHDLFEEGAAWQDAIANLDAVKLHSWMIRHYLTDDELIRISDFLNANEVALIIEAEPLDPPDPAECDHTESYEGPYEIENAQRLSDLGVEVAAYAVEQPFSYGYKLEGPGACRYELDRVLSEVVAWADDLRAIFPDIPIGSIEALWDLPMTTPADFGEWLDAWTEAMGEPPAFQHVDVNWAIPDWPEILRGIEEEVESRGIPFGPLYTGWNEGDNDAWIDRAVSHFAIYEGDWGGTPGHFTIQSWSPQPDRLLPDDDVHAMTNIINRYLGARPTFTDVSVDDGEVTGTIQDLDGQPLEGLAVTATREAGGDRHALSMQGTVPQGATDAVILYRGNFEDSIDVAVDATIHSISYVEDGSGANTVPNGAMASGSDTWGIYDDNAGSARFVGDDGDGALQLTAARGERLLVDGTSFPVTTGASYTVDVDVSVADPTSHGVIGLGFLIDGSEFQRSTLDLVGDPVQLGASTADPTGSFSITVGDPSASLTLATPGDAATWSARHPVT